MELEEIESCRNSIKTTDFRMGMQLGWHRLLVLLFEKTVLFTPKRVCKTHFMTKLCNYCSMLIMLIVELPVDNSTRVMSRVRTYSERNESRYQYLSSEALLIICWREPISFLYPISNTKLVNCNWRHSLPNTMFSLTCFRRKVKTSNSLSGQLLVNSSS